MSAAPATSPGPSPVGTARVGTAPVGASLVGTVEAPLSAIRWRGLPGDLWVARRDGRHLGAVQHGRRWTALDADSAPIGAYRTFAEAQQAVAAPQGAAREFVDGRNWGALMFVGAMSASAAMLLGVWPLLPL